jgi:hypothetical protein
MTEYDKVQQRITRPIKDAVKGINSLVFGTTSENKLQKSINGLSKSLGDCHNSIMSLDINITKEVSHIAYLNAIYEVKPALNLLQETGSFVKDIMDDVHEFYGVSVSQSEVEMFSLAFLILRWSSKIFDGAYRNRCAQAHIS